MAYTVFALKWRPKNFDELVGQEHLVGTLKSALQSGRLANAYLFAGPRGVGKTSSARILAKALNCQKGPTVNPCGSCPSCVEISEARSLDVMEIDGASNRGIDEIRALRENVKFSPVRGKYKIYIIDEVHQITADGFNALLKTLEEPPPFVKFIFATTQPSKVIPTILSRCQRFDFRRISTLEVIAQLEKIARAEGISVEKDVLLAIAKSSDGSLRDAESVLDQLASFSKEKISLADVLSVLGLIEEETLFGLTEAITRKDSRAALSLLNSIVDEGKDLTVFLSHLIIHFRNLMVAKVAQADPRLIDLPKESCVRLLEQSKCFTLEEIFVAFNTLVNTQELSRRLDSLRIPLEVSLIKLTQDKKGRQVAHDPPPVIPQENKSVPSPAREPQPGPDSNPDSGYRPEPPQASVRQFSLDEVKGAWPNVISNLGRIKMSVATYLNDGVLSKMENNVLTIAFPKNLSLHKESLERKENKAIIEKMLSELSFNNLRVNFMLSKEVQQPQDGEHHPYLKSILDTFDGRLIKEE